MESQRRILIIIMDIHNSIMDIHYSIMDIHNCRAYALLAFHMESQIKAHKPYDYGYP